MTTPVLSPSSYICQLNENTKNFAKETLGETDDIRTTSIEQIREWIRANDRIKARDDDYAILSFLRCAKFDVERAKKLVQTFFEMKSEVPEWFENRNPLSPAIQELVKLGVFVPLKKFHDNKLVVIIRTAAHDPRKHKQDDVFKAGNMLLDIAVKENFDNATIFGVSAIFDMRGVTWRHGRQLPPRMIKKAVHSWQNYTCRPKQLEFVNAPAYINIVLNIFKGYMSEKLKGRVRVHFSGTDSLHSVIPKDILPIEYGGKDETMQELIDYWDEKLVSYSDWFKEDEKYKATL